MENITQSSDYIQKIVYWDCVERSGSEEYDEAFLASLRAEVKCAEGEKKPIIIIPRRFSGDGSFWGFSDSEIMNQESEIEFFESFTSAMVHVARRIKDCKNIVGFLYPDFESDWSILQHYSNEYKEKFKAAFQKKHSHYIFTE